MPGLESSFAGDYFSFTAIADGRAQFWGQSLSMLTLIQFIRLHYQQKSHPNIPRYVRFGCLLYAFLSAAAKIVFTITGIFMIDRIHSAGLFLLFLDHLGVVIWYWWLTGSATETRKLLRYISVHLSLMASVLLAMAIFGTVSKLWINAIEVYLPRQI